MPILSIALAFFLVTNPIGNSPAIISLIKDFDFKRQKQIVLREALLALLVALFFQYCGEIFLDLLKIQNYTLSFSGGILLFIVALEMIFSVPKPEESSVQKKEPFLVPIATPLLSGAGLLSIILYHSRQEASPLKISLALCIAWVGVIFVLCISPYLQKILGQRGLVALEQLMGMLLSMMSVGMIVKGVSLFINAL